MFALIQTFSPKKKHFVIRKAKLTNVGNNYFAFTPGKLEKPELCKVLCNGDKNILSEVATNLNRSLPSVSFEINDTNLSFNDGSIIASSTTSKDRSCNTEPWDKPELSRSITDSMLVTSSPIVDKKVIEPAKVQIKVKNTKRDDPKQVAVSKYKKSTPLLSKSKKDITDNMSMTSGTTVDMPMTSSPIAEKKVIEPVKVKVKVLSGPFVDMSMTSGPTVDMSMTSRSITENEVIEPEKVKVKVLSGPIVDMSMTSGPIVEKNVIEPEKVKVKVIDSKVLDGPKKIDVSKYKKSSSLLSKSKKDITENMSMTSSSIVKKKVIESTKIEAEVTKSKSIDKAKTEDLSDFMKSASLSKSDITESMMRSSPTVEIKAIKPTMIQDKVTKIVKKEEAERKDLSNFKRSTSLSKTDGNDLNREKNKENRPENAQVTGKELDEVPIMFIDHEGNLQSLSDIDEEIKELVCGNKIKQINDINMSILDNYNDNDALVDDNDVPFDVDPSTNLEEYKVDNSRAVLNTVSTPLGRKTESKKVDPKDNDDYNPDSDDNDEYELADECGKRKKKSSTLVSKKEQVKKNDTKGDNDYNHKHESANDIGKRTRKSSVPANQKTVSKANAKGIEINANVMSEAFKFGDVKIVGQNHNQSKKKKYPCFYCGKELSTLSRHYKDCHEDEDIVKEIKEYETGRRKKGEKITDTQKYVDYLYSYLRKSAIMNAHLRAGFEDQFHIARLRRQSKEDRTVSMYLLCTNCSGFYANSYFNKHVKKCTNNTKSTLQARLESNAAIGKKNVQISKYLQKVLLNLRKGTIKNTIENDSVIIKFGNGLSFKHRHYFHLNEMIRARLRCVARLITIVATMNNNTVDSYTKFFCPENFDLLFPAINEIGQYNPETDLYDVPATAAAAGAYIKELCDVYIGMCIRNKDKIGREAAIQFLHLYTTDYNKYVSKTVAESQLEMQRNKKVELPTEADLALFYSSITSRRDELVDDLKKNGFNKHKWIELGENITVHLVMFSGRRVGETERLKKTNFSKIERLESNDDSNNLSLADKEFLQTFRRVLIRGKLNRTVPLIMTDKDEVAIKLYMSLSKHKDAGVDKNNPYVFAVPGHTYKHQRACDNIRKMTNAIKGLKHPERLRGTLFRKNISTIALSLNLSNGTRTDLYDVLGHSGKIHKNIYAQNQFQQQVLTIAPILLKASTAVTQFDEEKCENDDEEEDISHYENLLPDMNAPLPKSRSNEKKPSTVSNVDKDDSRVVLNTVSTPLGRKKESKKVDSKFDDDYNPDYDDYDEYESADECGKRKRKSSVPAKFSNDSMKQKRIRWTSEQEEAVSELYSAYLKRPITHEEIQKVINDNPCLKDRDVAKIRSRFHKLKNTPMKKKPTEEEKMSTSLTRNCVPLAIYTHFQKNIDEKRVPTKRDCLSVLNLSSPSLEEYSIPQIQELVKKAIDFDTKE